MVVLCGAIGMYGHHRLHVVNRSDMIACELGRESCQLAGLTMRKKAGQANIYCIVMRWPSTGLPLARLNADDVAGCYAFNEVSNMALRKLLAKMPMSSISSFIPAQSASLQLVVTILINS